MLEFEKWELKARTDEQRKWTIFSSLQRQHKPGKRKPYYFSFSFTRMFDLKYQISNKSSFFPFWNLKKQAFEHECLVRKIKTLSYLNQMYFLKVYQVGV